MSGARPLRRRSHGARGVHRAIRRASSRASPAPRSRSFTRGNGETRRTRLRASRRSPRASPGRASRCTRNPQRAIPQTRSSGAPRRSARRPSSWELTAAGALERLMLGSVAESVLHRAGRPVATLRGSWHTDGPIRRIVCGADLVKIPRPCATRLPSRGRSSADLVVVHAVKELPEEGGHGLVPASYGPVLLEEARRSVGRVVVSLDTAPGRVFDARGSGLSLARPRADRRGGVRGPSRRRSPPPRPRRDHAPDRARRPLSRPHHSPRRSL